MLEAAAAAQWQVPVSEVEAKNHEVVHKPSGRKLGYGALAKAAANQPVPARETLRLKDPSQFRYVGKGQLKLVDGRDIATGKAQYGIDTRLDGMLYAVVARPPVYGGKVASFDAGEALKVPGVVKVVAIEGSPAPPVFNPLGGVAVIARNTWAAMQGRKALKITWDDGPNASYDSAAFKADARGGGAQARPRGAQRRQRRRRDGERRQAARARSTTSRISRTRPWSRRRPPRASCRGSARCGAASSHRRPRATWSRSAWACPRRTSPST